MKFTARFFSVVLHPLLMPVYVFSFIFLFLPELLFPIKPNMHMPLLGLIATATFVLPCITIYLLYKAGVVSKVNIEDRKDRFVPQILSSLIYLATSWLFYSKLAPVPSLYIIMTSITACMVLVTTINFFWKISAHSTAMGGLSAFMLSMFSLYGYDFLLPSIASVILLAGIVMASRLYLHVHTLAQVCGGFVLGITTGLICLSNIS
jgi:membrane-associated phospholipid phosphatase